MTDMTDFVDEILTELHRTCGYCSHCGKYDCPGKKTGSNLPKSLPTHKVIAALKAVRDK